MAGNMWEWTTEENYHKRNETTEEEEKQSEAQYAVFRGGCLHDFGSVRSLSIRSGDISAFDGIYLDYGFRVVLYIK